MAIELKKVQNVETLALGFNYEASIDLSTLGTTAGSATAVDIQVGEAAMAGGIFGAAIIVDELVVGTSITDATIAIGDDGDADGFVDEVLARFLLSVFTSLVLLTSPSTSRVKDQT